MLPTEIDSYLRRFVIGQEEVLRFVSVAIFKHLSGERFGNLMMIGNSGSGKTTVMRAMERLYADHDEFAQYRVVVILNANTFATDEGVVDTTRLFQTLEERARQLLGNDAPAEEIGRYMEHATVCLDEVDKVSGVVGGKPYVTGINIQQALLTMIEGERVIWDLNPRGRSSTTTETVDINTGKMLFLCAGAFEKLYDQVFDRVVSPTSRVKLPTETVIEDGEVEIREYFTLRHHFKQEDLFDYGMQPQFLARFDNSIILEDLDSAMLVRIFTEIEDGVFRTSREFFKKYAVDLQITESGAERIAREAAKSRRIGARALKEVWGRIIKRFEYDPFNQPEVREIEGRRRLTIDDAIIVDALKPAVEAFI